jgi:hypothetical protein
MSNLSVLFTSITIPLDAFMLYASHERSKCREASFALKNGFLILGGLLMVRETRLAPNVSITFGAGDSDGEGARRPRQSLHVRSQRCVASLAHDVTRFTHVLLRHGTRHIHDDVIVSFDIIVE